MLRLIIPTIMQYITIIITKTVCAREKLNTDLKSAWKTLQNPVSSKMKTVLNSACERLPTQRKPALIPVIALGQSFLYWLSRLLFLLIIIFFILQIFNVISTKVCFIFTHEFLFDVFVAVILCLFVKRSSVDHRKRLNCHRIVIC